MTDRDDDPVAPEDVKPTEALSDIYAEDGSVRSDFLTMVGAAIADRDLLFLRKNVARLHESELGDVLESILPEQRHALVRLLGSDFDMTALTEVDEGIGSISSTRCRTSRLPPVSASSIRTTRSTFSRTSTTKIARISSHNCRSPSASD